MNDGVEIIQIDGRPGDRSRAIHQCVEMMPAGFFNRATMFCPEPFKSDTVQWVQTPSLNHNDYSQFLLQAAPQSLGNADHVLIVQDDGYILNPDVWDDQWLEYDYIGAPWPFAPYVGNGGFSLRSKRFMEESSKYYTRGENEDVSVCRTHRAALEGAGMKFAPVEVARRFARELVPVQHPTFGFHGSPGDIVCAGCGHRKQMGYICCYTCRPFIPHDILEPAAQIEWLRCNSRQ